MPITDKLVVEFTQLRNKGQTANLRLEKATLDKLFLQFRNRRTLDDKKDAPGIMFCELLSMKECEARGLRGRPKTGETTGAVSQRVAGAVVRNTAVGLDFDNADPDSKHKIDNPVTIEEIKERLKGLAFLWHTTTSSMPQWEKFRVIVLV